MAKSDNTHIGLFMTADTITIVQADEQRARPQITAIGSAPSPAGSIESGTIFEPSQVAQAIRLLLRQMNITAETASVAFSSDAYSMRTFRFPEAPDNERRSLVRGELDQSGMLASVRDEFDFVWLPAPAEQGRRQADASVYFSDAGSVESIRDTLRLAGLDLVRLEPASLALMRSYITVKPASVAILCPSRKHSDLAIFDGAHLRSVRRIPTGSDDLLAENNNNVTASKVRRTIDGEQTTLPDGSISLLESAESPVADTANIPDNSSVGFLGAEVARSLAFLCARVSGCGATAKACCPRRRRPSLRASSSLLQSVLPVPTSSDAPVSEFGAAALNIGTPASAYARLAAIGMAIGSDSDTVPALNLAQISEATRLRRKAPVVLLAGMGGSALWMVAAIAASVVLTYLTSQKIQQSAEIAKQTADIQAVRAPLLLKQQAWEAAESEKAKTQVPAGSVLGRAAASTTAGVMLTSIKVSGDGKIALEGRAVSSQSMQNFADALGQGKAIRNPIFEAMHKDAKAGTTFRIVGAFHALAKPEAQSKQFQ